VYRSIRRPTADHELSELEAEYLEALLHPEMYRYERLELVRQIYLAMIKSRSGSREALQSLLDMFRAQLDRLDRLLSRAGEVRPDRARADVWNEMISYKRWLREMYEGLAKKAMEMLHGVPEWRLRGE
jgi:hypothetical protein